MPKEQHPYLKYFDQSRIWKSLIIGTFPPKFGCDNRTDLFRYFYGNVGSLWSIIESTNVYPEYDFSAVEREGKQKGIKDWQVDFSVGVVDVLKSCKRKLGSECSSNDKDLIVELKCDLNDSLRDYILKHIDSIERVCFTSGSENNGSNSAFYFFVRLMGQAFVQQHKEKLVKLPSPSGSSTLSLFKGPPEKYGLIDEFYLFLEETYPAAIDFARETWKKKQQHPSEKITRLPTDKKYSLEYKIWSYAKHLDFRKQNP